MPRVTRVEHAAKDYPQYGIKKGDTYYWWKFRYGGKRYSLTPPKGSQLTQSSFYSTLRSAEESISDASDEDLATAIADAISDLESLRDEQEGNLQNMPEALQSGPTGELLQNRVDEVQSLIDELEGINTDEFAEPEPEPYEYESEDGQIEEDAEAAFEQAYNEWEESRDSYYEEMRDAATSANWGIE